MAATKIVKQPKEVSEVGLEGSTETQEWLVYCNSNSDTATVARDAVIVSGMTIVAQVPPYLSPHPVVTQMVVKSKSAKRLGGARNIFSVTVNYAIPQVSWGAAEDRPSGTNVKWNKSVSVSGVEVQEATNTNYLKKAIKNTAGMTYNPGSVVKTYYDELINITYSTDVIDADAIGEARGMINAADVTLTIVKAGITRTVVYPALTLKCGNVSYSYEYDQNGQGVINVTLPLTYRYRLDADGTTEIGWKRKIVNEGYGFIPAGGTKVMYTPGVLVQLDASGHPLASGADCLFVVEQIEDAIDFAPLLAGI